MGKQSVVLHPGFHKSGTTSLQHFLDQNKTLLSTHINVLSWGDFPEITKIMRPVSKVNLPILDGLYRKAFRAALSSVDTQKHLVLSREILLGMVPGNKDILGRTITSYAHSSLRLLPICLDEIKALYGEDVDIIVFLTVRDHDTWMWSVYRHLVKVNLRTGSFVQFQRELRDFTGTHAEADALIAAHPDVTFLKSRLEDVADKPLGHAELILKLLEIPQAIVDQLQRAERKHVGIPTDRIEDLIAINRYSFRKKAARKRKEKLLSNE